MSIKLRDNIITKVVPGCIAIALLFALFSWLIIDVTPVGQDTHYKYADIHGTIHTVDRYEAIPERYRGRVSVTQHAEPGSGSFLRITSDLSGLFEAALFWLPVCIGALLYGSGKLDEWYYRFLNELKRKQGIEGLYRERRSQTHEAYLELIFCLAGKISRSDGMVQRVEIDAVELFITNRLRLSEHESQKAKQFFRKGRDSVKTFEQFLAEFKDLFGNRKQLTGLAYTFLEELADADGKITPEEEALLKTARAVLGIKSSHYSKTPGSGEMSSLDAYEILEVSPQDTFEAIKKVYRKKVFELHPDRLNAQGMSPEFIELAKEQFLRVQSAYEKIEAERAKK